MDCVSQCLCSMYLNDIEDEFYFQGQKECVESIKLFLISYADRHMQLGQNCFILYYFRVT